MKGVAIGDGFELAGRVGSRAHDEIFWSERTAPAAWRAA
jgi:chorismate synthase